MDYCGQLGFYCFVPRDRIIRPVCSVFTASGIFWLQATSKNLSLLLKNMSNQFLEAAILTKENIFQASFSVFLYEQPLVVRKSEVLFRT